MSAYKSLAPCTVLVTRPREDADQLTAELVERGVTVIAEPLMTIVPKPDAALDLTGVQAALLTSANGARAFAGATGRRDLRVLAVGDQTARIARAAGFAAVESASGDLEDLARIVAVRLDPKDGALLHVAGRDVAGDLAGRLARDGFAVRRAVLYQAEAATALSAATRAAIEAGGIDAVLLFSPRTAATFVSLIQAAGLATRTDRLALVCLSPAVAAAAEGPSWRAVVTAKAPTQSDLLAAFERWRGGGEQSGSDDMAERATTGKPDHPDAASRPGPVIDVTPLPDSPRPHAAMPDSTAEAKAPAPATGGVRLVLTLILLAVVLAVAAIAARPIWQGYFVSSVEPPAPVQPSPALADGQVVVLGAQLAQALDRLAQSERRAGALESRLGALDTEILALKGAARQPATDDRVAGAISRLSALEAEIKSVPRGSGEAAPDAVNRLARLEAALKAVPSVDLAALAQIRTLAERADAEQSRLGERLAALEARQSAAQDGPHRAAALALAIGQLGQALRGSVPFQAEFDAAGALAGADAAIARALDPLRGPAGSGVATVDQLRQRFPAVVSAIKQAEARGTDEGLIGAALARLARLVTIRRIDGAGGIDAMLARAERALTERDLAGALAALADLPDPVKAAARPWLGQAEARLAAEQALARLAQLAAAAVGAAKP